MNSFTRGSLFLLLSCLMTCHSYGQTDQAKKVYQLVEKSVFTIETDKAIGTGFVIDCKPLKGYTKTWEKDFQATLSSVTGQEYEKASSGVVMLTAYHVVADAKTIHAVSPKGTKYKVTRIYGYSKATDIAVLYLDEGPSTKGLEFGDYSIIAPGDAVFVIGTALGFLENSLTSGIVSARRESEGIPLLQFTAAVSQGNSGSPVVNAEGKVVAMVSHSYEAGQSLNIGVGSSELVASLVRSKPATSAFPIEAGSLAATVKDGKDDREGGASGDDDELLLASYFAIYNRCSLAQLKWDIAAFSRELTTETIVDSHTQFRRSSDCADIVARIKAKYPQARMAPILDAMTLILNSHREVSKAYGTFLIDVKYPSVSDTDASWARVETAMLHLWEGFDQLLKAIMQHPKATENLKRNMMDPCIRFFYHGPGMRLGCLPDPVLKDVCLVAAAPQKAQFAANDRIVAVKVDDKDVPISNWSQLTDVVTPLMGKVITFIVVRKGKTITLLVPTKT